MSEDPADLTPSDVRKLWQPVRSLLRQLGVPCEIQWLGGGCIVMEIPSEDPNDRVWLGAQREAPIGDGPWLTRTLDVGVVGGYRQRWDDDASADDSSALDFETVTSPGDALCIADAMAAVWRRLRAAEIRVPPAATLPKRPSSGPSLGL